MAARYITMLSFLALAVASPAASSRGQDELGRRFAESVQPLLKQHCLECHAGENPEAKLDLGSFDSPRAVAANPRIWQLVRRRLEAGEMPPEDAKTKPS